MPKSPPLPGLPLSWTMLSVFPRTKLLVAAVVGIVAAVDCSSGEPNTAWEKETATFRANVGFVRAPLQLWDDHVVGLAVKIFSFSADDLQPKELDVPGMDEIISIGTVSQLPVALGRTNGRLLVMMRKAGQWTTLPMLPALQKSKNAQIIPAGDGLVILSADDLFRFKDGKWLPPLALPKTLWRLPKSLRGFKMEEWGARQILFGTQLFAGWDEGEFGGMLLMLDLSSPKRKWKAVSGQKEGSSGSISASGPVSGFTIDSANSLWVSFGLAHMGGLWKALYRYDGKKWDAIVPPSLKMVPDRPVGSGASFAEEATDICDVYGASDKQVYVLAGASGIFTCENGVFKRRISINFHDISGPAMTAEGKKMGFDCNCYPVGLVVDSGGNLFVNSLSFGVLCFIKSPGGYHLKQVFRSGAQYLRQVGQ